MDWIPPRISAFLQYLRAVRPPLEGLGFPGSTPAAVSGLGPHVHPLMDTEAGLPAEGLPTLGTLVRLLSCMDPQM